MPAQIIAPFGTEVVAVAASKKIAVYSRGPRCVVSRQYAPGVPGVLPPGATGPGSLSVLGTQNASHAVYGTFSSTASTNIIIEAGPLGAMYEVGDAPQVFFQSAGILSTPQPTPTAKTVAATLTITELKTLIITGTHTAGATQAYTLPTGALTDAGLNFAADDSFDWTLINLSAAAADTITLTAAASGHTIVGNPIVQSAHSSTGGIYGNSARFRTRKTAADTYVTYRVA